jgi:hypothetical protein
MLDILEYLPARKKTTPSGWISFNSVCCEHNGNSRDTRQRGGLKPTDQNWSYHCFNCGYTASFILGRMLSFKARRLLGWMGVPDREIDILNLESMRHRNINGILDDRMRVSNSLQGIEFDEVDEFPPRAETVTPAHAYEWEYLRSRHVPEDFPTLTVIDNDGIHWTRPQVIIPFTHDGKIVGWTARMLDGKAPKFISHSQPGYVFGIDQQPADWQHVLVMEGIFDALSINGLAVMHNEISDQQARLIRSLGRTVTVVPDQDSAGVALIDRALDLGWAVSMPEWDAGIKDVNDAVKKYGQLATLLTIMQARETSRIKIELRKKQLVKRIRN